MRELHLLLIAVFILSGCASVSVTKVTSGDEEGIRFYRPHPYLLVTEEPPAKADAETGSSAIQKPKSGQTAANAGASSAPADSTGNVNVQIVWLPDLSESYAIRTNSGLGAANSSVTLKDGWQLTQFGGSVDTKIPETITAFTGALQAAAGVAKTLTVAPPARSEKIKPGLYRLEFNKGMVTRIVGPIEVFPAQ